MRKINMRRALMGAFAFLEWYISGKILGYKFVEVPGPVTVDIRKD